MFYLKRTYKTLHFYKLSTRTSLLFKMLYVIHIKESVEAVADKKLIEIDLS